MCKAVGLNLPFASVSSSDAAAPPDGTAYTGGTILPGKYYLTSVTHYGGGTYSGTKQEQYTIDTTAEDNT